MQRLANLQPSCHELAVASFVSKGSSLKFAVIKNVSYSECAGGHKSTCGGEK